MKTFSRMVLAAAVTVGLIGAAATMARADDWNDHEHHARDWHEHHRHHHDHGRDDDRDHDRPVIVQEPNVVYAPPVVVEPPPEPEESSGLSIVFPINIH